MNPKEKAKLAKAKLAEKKTEASKVTKAMLANYQLDNEVGNGVSSRVYSAIDINSGERVAIKKIKNFL